MTEDTRVREDGSVTGTLKYVDSYEAFSAGASGNFFALTLGEKYEGKTISVTSPTKTKEVVDREWVLKVTDNKTTFKFVNKTDGNEEIVTLNFADTKLLKQ